MPVTHDLEIKKKCERRSGKVGEDGQALQLGGRVGKQMQQEEASWQACGNGYGNQSRSNLSQLTFC